MEARYSGSRYAPWEANDYLSMSPPHSTMHENFFAKQHVPMDLAVQAVRDLRIVFACFQKTKHPVITINQLADIVELLGEPRPAISNLQTIVTQLVHDKNDSFSDKIDFKKFVRFFVSRLQGSNIMVRAKDIFRALDVDDSGEVSAEEIQESLRNMGLSLNSDEVLAMTSVADTSKEGEISYNQFHQIWRRIDSELEDKPAASTVVKNVAPNAPMIRNVVQTVRKKAFADLLPQHVDRRSM